MTMSTHFREKLLLVLASQLEVLVGGGELSEHYPGAGPSAAAQRLSN